MSLEKQSGKIPRQVPRGSTEKNTLGDTANGADSIVGNGLESLLEPGDFPSSFLKSAKTERFVLSRNDVSRCSLVSTRWT